MLDSKYSYHIVNNTLRIVDLFHPGVPSKTVTNNVEQVISELKESLGELPKNIVYRDTEFNWDRIIINQKCEFVRFAPCSDRKNGRI